jgi:hypothetical protein
MNQDYFAAVKLLLAIAPFIFRKPMFALKGGTAINLFVQEMPRLSVDLDLVYIDHETGRDAALAQISSELSDLQGELHEHGFICDIGSMSDGNEVKLFVQRERIRVKIEVNHVFRGTILPVQSRALVAHAQDIFFTDLEIPVLHHDELYGSKLVAAMDRQHPRDLFDVEMLYAQGGLTPGIVECFICYLAGHNRPIHEVLFANQIDISSAYNNEFVGMTREPIRLNDLLAARQRLFAELPNLLTPQQRQFLIGLVSGQPDWTLVGCPHLQELPAIRWKMQNLSRLSKTNREKFARQAAELCQRLKI